MSNLMMNINAQAAISYPIKIGRGLLAHPQQWLPHDDRKLVIITDDEVKKHYGERLVECLKADRPMLFSFAPGEQSKNYQTKQSLEQQMIEHRCHRETLILALGGGVVGDIAGFIAATYMRGIPYIQIPTTLLAMVDSSVGGKTGINTSHGKNLIGAFWQPICVITDIDCLNTLAQTHLINGLIEAIKIFMTSDKDSFDHLSKHLDHIMKRDFSILEDIIERAITLKIEIVKQDEKEHGLRMVLNFGHTIAHALEKINNYEILHGYAVALGILVEAKISQLLGLLSESDYQTIESLFFRLHISGRQLIGINAQEMVFTMQNDKKNKQEQTRYILLKKLGKIFHEENTFAHPVSDEIVKKALLAVSEV